MKLYSVSRILVNHDVDRTHRIIASSSQRAIDCWRAMYNNYFCVVVATVVATPEKPLPPTVEDEDPAYVDREVARDAVGGEVW